MVSVSEFWRRGRGHPSSLCAGPFLLGVGVFEYWIVAVSVTITPVLHFSMFLSLREILTLGFAQFYARKILGKNVKLSRALHVYASWGRLGVPAVLPLCLQIQNC